MGTEKQGIILRLIMDILILNWRDPKNPKSGGAELVTHEHAKAWVKAGHEVTWFTSSFPGSQSEEVVDGVFFVRRANSFTVYFLAPLYYFFSGKKFDVVIDEIHGLPFFTPLYARIPKVAFIHEIAGEIWDYMHPYPLNKVGRSIEQLYFTLYKGVLFWTDAASTVAELEHYGIPRQHCTVIPCALSNKARTTLPRKEKHPTYIFMSRLVPMKGIEEVIRAFRIIRNKQNSACLWIVGSGDTHYVQHLKLLVDTYGLTQGVRFFGKVTEAEKFELMSRAHLLLHASVKEGWGLVVAEAASQATPSVVYNVGGLRDIVTNGRTGIVLSRNTFEEMAEQALLLMEVPKNYRHMQKNCLSWSQSLTWGKATRQSLKLIESIVRLQNK